MAQTLPSNKRSRIKKLIYQRADEAGYAISSRIENGRFLDELVNDPDIGGVLKDYMEKERVRTYIKDGVLNAYTKDLTKKVLSKDTPSAIVQSVYGIPSEEIQRYEGVTVLRAETGKIFVISKGRVLKWETALRKALELIERQPGLVSKGMTPEICLQLAMLSSALTGAEKQHIQTALSMIGVKAIFCGD